MNAAVLHRQVVPTSIRSPGVRVSQPTKGALYFLGNSAYFRTKSRVAEVVAETSSVEKVLRGLRGELGSPVDMAVASVTGRVKQHPEVKTWSQMMVTDIKVAGATSVLERSVTRRGNDYIGVFGGKEVQVKPMTDDARDLMAAAVANQGSSVYGRLGAKGIFGAWYVSVPAVVEPPAPPWYFPTSALIDVFSQPSW